MGESTAHVNLVIQLVEWIADNFFDGDKGYIFCDLPENTSMKKPPLVGDFIPDAYACIKNSDHLIIGEAKTSNDFLRQHTVDQIEAFLNECLKFQKSTLIFAVPWDMVRFATTTIKRIQFNIKAYEVKVDVI